MKMDKVLGIRREDKNRWERRVPLIPDHLWELARKQGIHALVQPSEIRVYPDEDFERRGARVTEDLREANTIFAVKEIPTHLLAAKKTYVYFSHTIKGQPYNMDMLKRLMSLECNLIDYERIVNEQNQRLIFFGAHAGYAGIIETLHAFGQKMKRNGIDSPLAELRQAYAYANLDAAKTHLKEIGRKIRAHGLPDAMCPLVVGFAGYGNVSRGAQEILDLLPVTTIAPNRLAWEREQGARNPHCVWKVEFREQDLVIPHSGDFDLQRYYDHPEAYEPVANRYLPHLDILVNCIYWTDRYPRLVTKRALMELVKSSGPATLKVIGDISCDIEGSIEITRDSTMPDRACYTYLPETDSYEEGIVGDGVTVMAVDNLPCEFSLESSMFFSGVLKGYVEDIVSADYGRIFSDLELPDPIKKALILHNGEFTDAYTYMQEFI